MPTYTVSGVNGEKFGPADEMQLAQWAREGRIGATTLMTCNETGQHLAAHMVPALSPLVGLPAPMVAGMVHPLARPAPDARAMLAFESRKKSAGIAYLLWFFFGTVGAHRFYTGNTGTGVAMLLITLVSFPLMFILVGFITIWITAVWAFVDIFLIPGMVERYNSGLVAQLI